MEIQNTGESLTTVTADKIIAIIKENDMGPGEKLPTEYELAEKLGVGRSTLREAVKLLISRNILTIRQGSGTFISEKRGVASDPLGLALINDDATLSLDLINVRLIFEPEFAALAAMNAELEEYEKIEAACCQVEKLIAQKKPYNDADIEFHRAIAAASGNRIVDRLVQIIHSSIETNIWVTADTLREETFIYHRQIANAVRDKDVQGARYSMIMHLNIQRNFVLKNIIGRK